MTRPQQPRGTSRAEARRQRYDRATAALDPPLALVDLDAFDRNAADLTRRAGNLPIRVATKSLRCRYLIKRALARPGYQGVMCYSLREALWLFTAGTSDDLLAAYPSVDRRALAASRQGRRAGRALHRLLRARRRPGHRRADLPGRGPVLRLRW